MKHLQFSLAIFCLAALSGCVVKQKILDAGLVSMTHTSVPEGSVLRETESVSGKFCSSISSDKGSIGLFDEAIKKAQASGGVDFISNATFWREGACVTVEGTGQKLAQAHAMTNPTASGATKRKAISLTRALPASPAKQKAQAPAKASATKSSPSPKSGPKRRK